MSTRVIALLTVMGLVIAACGEGDTSDPLATTTSVSATTTTSVVTTTTLPDTTTTPATTSTTVPATTTTTRTPPPAGGYVVVEASIFPAQPLPNSGGAGGSGCAPGPGALPDGIWYGTVLGATQDSVDFDLACFYYGDIAYEVGAAAGEDDVTNDYFILNDNPTIRTVPVAAGAMVWSIPGDLGDLVPLSFATDWPPDWARAYAACPGDFCGMWLYINQGTATELVEQYVP